MLDGVKLIECFRTFQGEGPDSGQAMLLLRFKYCNRHCYFCDTSVQMRIAEEGEYSIRDIQEKLTQYRCGLMITGGEPTFKAHYQDTLKLLQLLKYSVANVETNGIGLVQMLEEGVWEWKGSPIKFIYSPKIMNEGDRYEATDLTHKVLDHPNVYIKIPFLNNDIVHEYCRWISKEITYRDIPNNKVWLQPIGATQEEQKLTSSGVMDACEKYKFNFSGRTHIMYDFI